MLLCLGQRIYYDAVLDFLRSPELSCEWVQRQGIQQATDVFLIRDADVEHAFI